MTEDRNFLARWSRRKHEAAREEAAKPAEKPAPKPAEKAPELPPLDSLTFDSDFTAYLAANVEESVKRAALKTLFSDPRFNVMDGLDVYIDDYTKLQPMPEDMLAKLQHARSTFEGLTQQAKADTNDEKTQEAKQETAKRDDDSEGTRGNPGQDA